jgi:N-acetylglutamate synthase-like GNAT family acetyltransferase
MTLLVLDRGERLAATAYLNVIPNLTRSASPYAVIENIVVDEPLRGTGAGKHIMGAALEVAWNAGCYKAMLLTGSRRASTHAFYRACGFTADEKTAYVARPAVTRSATPVRSDALSAHEAKIEFHRRAVGDRHEAANTGRGHVELAPGKGERANRLDHRV